MSSLISESGLATLEKTRKIVLKLAIWVLVGAVVLGGILILTGGSSSSAIFGKFMGTLFIIALMMIISVNNFKRIASRDPIVQAFALLGLIFNIAWAILWTIICWNPELASEQCNRVTFFACGMSMLYRIALACSLLSALGFIGSNVMSIYEGSKKGLIKPLKITAVICATYELLYSMVTIFADFDYSNEWSQRLMALAGFVGFAWIVIVIVAVVISKNEQNSKNKQNVAAENTMAPGVKTDEQLRAEIEEKVRREMMEKEVRERLQNDQNQNVAPQPLPEATPQTMAAPQPEVTPQIGAAPLSEEAPAGPAPQATTAPTDTQNPLQNNQ